MLLDAALIRLLLMPVNENFYGDAVARTGWAISSGASPAVATW